VSDAGLRALSAVGFFAMIGIAWACSSNRRRIAWRTVAWGVALQVGLGVLLLRTAAGRGFFVGVDAAVSALLSYSDAGARFVFGSLADTGFSFVVNVLPIIAFMDRTGTILNIATMQANDDSSHVSEGPAMYALEMESGWFEVNGIEAGTRVKL
jgi:nucleoside permease NupC